MRPPHRSFSLAAGICALLTLVACGARPPAQASSPTSRSPRVEPTTSSEAATSARKQRLVNGAPFVYETHGEGFPIVFLHGLPTDRRSVVPRFEPLFSRAGSTWRRIYPDTRGAGETPGRAEITDFDGYVAEIAEFIEQETGGQRLAIVGVSWGAYLATAYAHKHPGRVAGLALLVPALGPPKEAVRPPRSVVAAEPGVFEGASPMIVGMMNAAATVHTRRVRELFERDVAPGAAGADHAFLSKVTATRLSYHDELRTFRFDAPALVLSGKQDALDGYVQGWEFAQRLPRATYAVLDRAGHAMAGEQMELVRAHMREWLARVREGLGGSYEQPGL